MATDYLNLWNSASQTKALSHTYWNDLTEAVDRVGESLWFMGLRGAISGWRLPETSTVSQVTQGYGMIGPTFCRTTTSTTISGIQAGSNFVYLCTDTSSGWAGGVAAKARATASPPTNADGTTTGLLLGVVQAAAGTGVTESSVYSAARANFLNLQGHRQTLTLSITASASSFKSTAYGWSTTIKCPTVSEVTGLGTSQELRWDTLSMSGAVFGVHNKSSNAATTYNGTVTVYGFLV